MTWGGDRHGLEVCNWCILTFVAVVMAVCITMARSNSRQQLQ